MKKLFEEAVENKYNNFIYYYYKMWLFYILFTFLFGYIYFIIISFGFI